MGEKLIYMPTKMGVATIAKLNDSGWTWGYGGRAKEYNVRNFADEKRIGMVGILMNVELKHYRFMESTWDDDCYEVISYNKAKAKGVI